MILPGLPHCSTQPEIVGLSPDDQMATLEMHNSLRAAILRGEIEGLPKAQKMPKLEWDSELEKEATM